MSSYAPRPVEFRSRKPTLIAHYSWGIFLKKGLDTGMDRPYHRGCQVGAMAPRSVRTLGLTSTISYKGVSGYMATLRKSDITSRVAARLGVSRAQGEAALNAVLGSIEGALGAGDRVVLTGFGSFEVRQVKARRVRPIRGGSAGSLITVAAHNRVGFTAGANLNEAAR